MFALQWHKQAPAILTRDIFLLFILCVNLPNFSSYWQSTSGKAGQVVSHDPFCPRSTRIGAGAERGSPNFKTLEEKTKMKNRMFCKPIQRLQENGTRKTDPA